MHKEMWLELHREIERLIRQDAKKCPAYAAHEVQGLMNEIEEKHRGHIELRGEEDNLSLYLAVDNFKRS